MQYHDIEKKLFDYIEITELEDKFLYRVIIKDAWHPFRYAELS